MSSSSRRRRRGVLGFAASSSPEDNGDDDATTTPRSGTTVTITPAVAAATNTTTTTIVSPVLQQVYPHMLAYRQQYGHVNIPLPQGRPLVTLRRLRTQNKLADSDIALLDALNFTWHSLEDVYAQNRDRFEEFVARLQQYTLENNGDVSPPKKYPADPELGAWVTGVRRLYVTGEVDPEHVAALNQLNFQWTSPRQCGSQFMLKYREIQERLLAADDDDQQQDEIWRDPTVVHWIKAVQKQHEALSTTRQHYLAQLLGDDWRTWTPPE